MTEFICDPISMKTEEDKTDFDPLEVRVKDIKSDEKEKSFSDMNTLNTRIKCEFCDHEEYMNKSSLTMHIRTVHMKELRYSCDECEYKTNNKHSLAKHQIAHTGEKPFGCSDCEKSFTSKSNLALHIKTVHLKELRFSCEVCNYKTNNKRGMAWHEAKHVGAMKPNECEKCGIVLETKKLFHNHMVTAHEFKSCETCGKSFSRLLTLIKHQKKHLVKKPKCPVIRDNKEPNIYTAEFKIDAVKRAEEVGAMEASEELKLSYKTLLEWRKITLNPSVCSLCGKEFSTNSNLKWHMQHNHPEADESPHIAQSQCDKCSKLFKHSRNLKLHLLKCTGPGPEKVKMPEVTCTSCDICGKSFKERRYLRDHIKFEHLDTKVEYPCEQCGKIFRRTKGLKDHIRCVHEKEKNYGCQFCGKMFFNLNVHRHHERKHTGDKPYQCENCGESCSKYLAKKENFQCLKCKAALVPVVFEVASMPKEPNDKKQVNNRKSETKVQCDKCLLPLKHKRYLKQHLTKCTGPKPRNDNLRELYSNKYHSKEENQDSCLSNTDIALNKKKDEASEIESHEMFHHADSKSIQGLKVENFVPKEENGMKIEQSIDSNLLELYMNKYELDSQIEDKEMNEIFNKSLNSNDPTVTSDSEGEIRCEEDKDEVHGEPFNSKANPFNEEEMKDEHTFVNLLREQSIDENCESSNAELIDDKVMSVKSGEEAVKDSFENQEIKSESEELISYDIETKLDCTLKEEDDCAVKSEYNGQSDDEEIVDEFKVEEPDSKERSSCKICNKNVRKIKEHIKWVHESEESLCCEFCSKLFTHPRRLREHIKTVHEEKGSICSFCDKAFVEESSLKRHLKLHTGERPFLCQQCGHWFKDKSAMIEHRNKHSKIEEFQCVECLKQLPSRLSLTNHVYKNHRVFPCDICGKEFKMNICLQKHKEFHLGIREVDTEDRASSCTICGKVFKHDTNLTTHMKLHSEGKVQCYICGKHYTSPRGLKEHITVKHEGISKFKCQICGKAFVKEKHLEVHNTTHMKPIQCEVCRQGYRNNISLIKHMEKEHQHAF